MDIFANLKMLITVTSVFPDLTKGYFLFSSCFCVKNRISLLLKESPGDHDIKILKSKFLLRTLCVCKSLDENHHKDCKAQILPSKLSCSAEINDTE